MQISKTRIASMALNNIGLRPLRSFDQKNKEAEACRENYDAARLITLEGALWNFASGWKVGVELAITPKPGWEKVYAYPNEALKVFQIIVEKGCPAEPFEVTDRMDAEGKLIHTNHLSPTFEYVRDKEIVTQFSWEFIDALSWQLAARIAMPLTKNPKLLEKCERNAAMKTASAQASTMNEGEEQPDDVSFYHAVRD